MKRMSIAAAWARVVPVSYTHLAVYKRQQQAYLGADDEEAE